MLYDINQYLTYKSILNKHLKNQVLKKGIKMAKKKKEESKLQFNDFVIFSYLALMFSVFPLIMHNKYFDITITKYNCFVYVSLGLVVFSIISFIIKSVLDEDNHKSTADKGNRLIKPEFWALAFAISNVFSCIVSERRMESLTGSEGRYMGMFSYVLLVTVFFILAKPYRGNNCIFYIFAFSTIVMYVIALAQQSGADIFGLKEGISKKQYYLFVSTMGNINIFASFIVIAFAVFAVFFICSEQIIMKTVSGIIVCLSAMVCLISNSDSVYLGVGIVVLFLFYIAIYKEKVRWYFLMLLLMAAGNFTMAFVNKYILVDYYKRDGISRSLENITINIVLLVILALFTIAIWQLFKKKPELLKDNKNKLAIGITVILVVLGVTIVAIAFSNDMSIVNFNYKWGNYRGFIWSKCIDAYKNFGMVNKIFGYGNETIKLSVSNPNYDEMMEITNRIYDNAHNEILQYLLTIGIVGVISYLGMVVCSISYMLVKGKNNVYVIVCASACIGYFAQSLVNLNQPFTTPFFFVFLALGVGFARGSRLNSN